MPEFFIADVRKRPNADLNMSQQAIPERREYSDEIDAALATIFSGDDESMDDPVPCGIEGCDNITMEWTAGSSAAQIDFYGTNSDQEEPQRFLSLYILSGNNAQEDQQAMKQLAQYADFNQCLNFPLVLHVTDEPLAAAWQHASMQAIRKGITPLVGAFLKTHFQKAPSRASA